MTGASVLFQDDDDEEVKALMIVGICVAILLIILIIVAIMVWRLKVYPKTKTHRKLSLSLVCLYVDDVVVDLHVRRLNYHKLASLLKSQWSM